MTIDTFKTAVKILFKFFIFLFFTLYYLITTSYNDPNYLQWLDSQSMGSVLYISLGSFLSISSAQMDEIIVGLRNSDVQFLWMVRGEASWLKENCGDMGMVVPWCDQLKV